MNHLLPKSERKLREGQDGYTAENEEQAPGIDGGALQGSRHSLGTPENGPEKDADGGDPFLGDGTKLMPHLRSIWKVGHLRKRGEYSTNDIGDLDAANQSFFTQPSSQRQSVSDVPNQPASNGSGGIGVSDDNAEERGSELYSGPKRKKVGHVLAVPEMDFQDDPKFLGSMSEVSMERLRQLAQKHGTIKKISQASYAALLDEFSKIAEYDVFDSGPESLPQMRGNPLPPPPRGIAATPSVLDIAAQQQRVGRLRKRADIDLSPSEKQDTESTGKIRSAINVVRDGRKITKALIALSTGKVPI